MGEELVEAAVGQRQFKAPIAELGEGERRALTAAVLDGLGDGELGQQGREQLSDAMIDTLIAGKRAGVEAAVAGAIAHDVATAVSRAIIDAGLGRYNGPRTGHGLAGGVHESPSIVEGSYNELPVGAVLTVETGVYIPPATGSGSRTRSR